MEKAFYRLQVSPGKKPWWTNYVAVLLRGLRREAGKRRDSRCELCPRMPREHLVVRMLTLKTKSICAGKTVMRMPRAPSTVEMMLRMSLTYSPVDKRRSAATVACDYVSKKHGRCCESPMHSAFLHL